MEIIEYRTLNKTFIFFILIAGKQRLTVYVKVVHSIPPRGIDYLHFVALVRKQNGVLSSAS